MFERGGCPFFRVKTALGILALSAGFARAQEAVQVAGELKIWHPITLVITGPETSEDATPNPFYNYRLQATFSNGAEQVVVPGYFAADGNAAETGAASGNKWHVKFTPHLQGQWSYQISFRQGEQVSIADAATAGQAVSPDGATGAFNIGPTDKSGRDHRYKGMLKYVGQHYAQYRGTKDYFIQVGSQSPENFFAYFEFDGTEDRGGSGPKTPDGLHHYEPHVKDWKEGDTTWMGGKGKGIIGALNYLASEGMNTYYPIINTRGGDGKDTWPWVEMEDHHRYDVSKLAQWDIVFSHGDRLGMQAMVVTQEEEAEDDLGRMTPERKLFYREIIARFAHHHAILWDLDEEMDKNGYYDDVQHIKDICEYFIKVDPYDHPIQYVQWKAEIIDDRNMPTYDRLYGYPNFHGTGLQSNYDNVFHYTKRFVDGSAKAGHKWLVGVIETNPNTVGVVPDENDYWHTKERTHSLWGNLMAGGSGIVFFFGYKYAHSDISLEDFRSRDHLWDLMKYAHEFFIKYLPFWEMKNDNDLTPGGDDYVYAKPGDIYAVYLMKGGSPELDLGAAAATDNFTVQWYNPRLGGELQNGSVTSVTGGSVQSLGSPPSDPGEGGDDWAILVKREGYELPTAMGTNHKRFSIAPGLSIIAPGAAGYDAMGRFIPSGSPAAKLLWHGPSSSRRRTPADMGF